MQYVLNKWQIEQIETSKQLKKIGNALLNAQQMLIQQTTYISLSIIFLSLNKIISIHKYI
jgi:hypothetical protein